MLTICLNKENIKIQAKILFKNLILPKNSKNKYFLVEFHTYKLINLKIP